MLSLVLAATTAFGAWDPVDERGAAALNMTPEFVHLCREGVELMYERRYDAARSHFRGLQAMYPETAVAPAMDALIWQAIMLENYDFKRVDEWKASTNEARAILEKQVNIPGHEAWEHFLLGGLTGLEAIDAARNERYMPALNMAFKALSHLEASRDAAPDFVDIQIADGMYNYWRASLARKFSFIPDFGDTRAEGVEQMQMVEEQGIFLGPAATLALTYSWLDMGRKEEALAATKRNQAAYPDNIINNMMLGSVYLTRREYPEAFRTFRGILDVDPENDRAHYLIGYSQLRMGRLDAAEVSFDRYLASDNIETWQVASTHYRQGQISAKRRDWTQAEEMYKVAAKGGNKPAKNALDNLRRLKREDRLPPPRTEQKQLATQPPERPARPEEGAPGRSTLPLELRRLPQSR